MGLCLYIRVMLIYWAMFIYKGYAYIWVYAYIERLCLHIGLCLYMGAMLIYWSMFIYGGYANIWVYFYI